MHLFYLEYTRTSIKTPYFKLTNEKNNIDEPNKYEDSPIPHKYHQKSKIKHNIAKVKHQL